jgi:hypothetical protein
MRTPSTIVASTIFIIGATCAYGQDPSAATPAPKKLDFTTIVSGSKGLAKATKIYIDTDTGYGAFLGSLTMTDPSAVTGLSSDLQQFDDNKYRAVAIELGAQSNTSAVAVTDVSTDGSTIRITYAATPAAAGQSAAPYCLVRFARQDGIPSSITSIKFVDANAPAVRALAFTTIVSGDKGPAQATKVFIDTDTGYGAFLGSLTMTDPSAVTGLPSDLQQFDDNKYRAVAIEVGAAAKAAWVKVTDVSTDGSTVTITYATTPAAAGATSAPYCLVRFERPAGVPSSITAVKFVQAPAPPAPVTVKACPKPTPGMIDGGLAPKSGN